MNPVQKWQNGMALNDYEKSVVRSSGYNPDIPYGTIQGSSPNLQGSSPNLQGSVPNLQPASTSVPATTRRSALFDALPTGDTLDTGPVNSPAPEPPPVPEFNPVSFNGQTYYDLASLNEAQRAYIDATNRENLSALDRALLQATGYSDPSQVTDINAVAADSTLGRSKSSLLKQVQDLLESYTKGEQQANGNLNSYYANLGDAYQSSQGVRQAETADQFNKARADANAQQTEGISSLQRTLSDYLNSDQTNRVNLARNYTTALDNAQNASTEDLSAVLGRGVTQADLAAPNVNVSGVTTNNNSGLLGALTRAAGNTFKLNTPNGATDTASILKYLYNA